MADNEGDILTKSKVRIDISEPKAYNVIYINDDKTPFDFVIMTLVGFYNHSKERASELADEVHEKGKAIVASNLTREMATHLVELTTQAARANHFPLQARVEQL